MPRPRKDTPEPLGALGGPSAQIAVSAVAGDYSTVTEATGGLVSRKAWEMMCARYCFVAGLTRGKKVLEVACGSGQGLGYISRHADRVVAGDLTRSLLRQAQRHYEGGTCLVNFDAHQLPFADRSFDVVILFEAIYYLSNPERFFQEAHRLLNEDGILVICSANPERRDFSPSPMSHRYFAAGDFRQILRSHGFRPSVYGAFPTRTGSVRDALVYLARRVAILLRVIPKTMRGKVWLKRLVYGRLVSIKPEVDDGPAPVLTPVTTKEAPDYKVIYAVGRRVASDGMNVETG